MIGLINKFRNRFKPRPKVNRVNIISFPKSGRTWFSIMVGKTICYRYDLQEMDFDISKSLSDLSGSIKGFPRIKIHHDGYAFWQKPEDLSLSKEKYKNSKVIFLVRDPRDVIVSSFFEKSKRIPARIKDPSVKITDPYIEAYTGKINEYVYNERGGIDTIIKFMNNWLDNKEVVKDFLIIKYEDLKTDTVIELKKVINFIGIDHVSDSLIKKVVDETSFENLKKKESNGEYESYALRPGNVNDSESFKVRKGKVGGYVDYLESREIEYLKDKIFSDLNPSFGYNE